MGDLFSKCICSSDTDIETKTDMSETDTETARNRVEKLKVRRASMQRAGLDDSESLPKSALAEVLQNCRSRSVLSRKGMSSDATLSNEDESILFKEGKKFRKSMNHESLCSGSITYESVIVAGFDPVDDHSGKECQDDIVLLENWEEQAGTSLLCVFDGHGPNGRKSANWLVRMIPKLLKKHLITSQLNPSEALENTFVAAHNQMQRSTVDTKLSGSTATVCLLEKDKLHIAWVGDSRAVLGFHADDEEGIQALPLTRDHKPDDPKELERILASGGVVEAGERGLDGHAMPPRVFSKDLMQVGEYSPGIAMSRSLGDSIAQSLGVSHLPEYACHQIDGSRDNFLVMASDGIWEVFTDKEAVEFIWNYLEGNSVEGMQLPGQDLNSPATSLALAEEAQRRWLTKFNKSIVVDDACVLIMWINHGLLFSKSMPTVDHRDVDHAKRRILIEKMQTNP